MDSIVSYNIQTMGGIIINFLQHSQVKETAANPKDFRK
jgi:hypothetical protein